MSTTQKALRTSPRSTTPTSGRLRVAPRALVLLVGMVLISLAAVYPIRLWLDQRDQLSTLTRQTQALRIENELLAGQVSKLRDPAYLEQLARACLGMVARGETAFVIIPKDGGSPPDVPCEIAMEEQPVAP